MDFFFKSQLISFFSHELVEIIKRMKRENLNVMLIFFKNIEKSVFYIKKNETLG